MSYVVCKNCGYRIPLSDIIRSETPTLTCPNCGGKYFYLYIDPQDFQAINYLISLLMASYIAPLIYHLQKT
jgi:DNA-directed RNA polymerase subunit RPC12/RpoP